MPEVTLESIKVTPPQKLEYTAGEELDTTGMTVTAVYSNGDEKDVTAEAEISGYNKDLEGAQKIEVSYTEGDVTVKEYFDVTVTAAGTDKPGTDEPGTDKPEQTSPDQTTRDRSRQIRISRLRTLHSRPQTMTPRYRQAIRQMLCRRQQQRFSRCQQQQQLY